MPRIKDLKDQQLYKVSRMTSYGPLDPVFRTTVDMALIAEQWDQLVRIAASLRHRTAPADVVLKRLANGAPSDRLAKALTALGRVLKTIHILRYVQDADLRHRIQRQLNRGEFRHKLARRLFFANQGAFQTGDYEEIMNKASCLSLLCNPGSRGSGRVRGFLLRQSSRLGYCGDMRYDGTSRKPYRRGAS